MPLVGFEGLALALPQPLRAPLLLHTFVLLEAGGGAEVGGRAAAHCAPFAPRRPRRASPSADAQQQPPGARVHASGPRHRPTTPLHPKRSGTELVLRLPPGRPHVTGDGRPATHRRRGARRRALQAAPGDQAAPLQQRHVSSARARWQQDSAAGSGIAAVRDRRSQQCRWSRRRPSPASNWPRATLPARRVPFRLAPQARLQPVALRRRRRRDGVFRVGASDAPHESCCGRNRAALGAPRPAARAARL